MAFIYSRNNLIGRQKALGRFFEILPGALSWLLLIGMFILSFKASFIAALIMIAFILYWVMRLFYMNIFLIISYVRLAVEARTDWMERIRDVDNVEAFCRSSFPAERVSSWRERRSRSIHRGLLTGLMKSGCLPPKSSEICHLVIIPVIKECRAVVEPGIRGIVEGGFPAKQVLLVIALEDAASDSVKDDMRALAAAYKAYFLDLVIITHPCDLPGEARVKGANCTYAAKKAAEFFTVRGMALKNIVVSCFDADTSSLSDYLSCLTYHYLITPDRNRSSYQPIPVYHNNIWEAPSFARVMEIGTSFFQMIESTNPCKLVTFSSHSMSFSALVEIGYWPVDMISDDSAVFWKALIHYKGQYRVVPMYTTLSMDIAIGQGWWKTMVSIYKQKRRWAWGVENFAVVARAFFEQSGIPLAQRIVYITKLLDTFVSWATWSFLLAIISWLPTIFASREFTTSTAYYALPRIKGTIFGLASIGVIVCMVLSYSLLPREAGWRHLGRRILHLFEWLFMPAFILGLSAFPALDAQTRLMMGWPMVFQVTEKSARKK
ncbi:MAG: glycosyltransferase family 2 protein [Candidatus Omnitrophica bacterium]|nr:glycosyltransferase family 2 protein [Candidatus Omnitrophota bacterium]